MVPNGGPKALFLTMIARKPGEGVRVTGTAGAAEKRTIDEALAGLAKAEDIVGRRIERLRTYRCRSAGRRRARHRRRPGADGPRAQPARLCRSRSGALPSRDRGLAPGGRSRGLSARHRRGCGRELAIPRRHVPRRACELGARARHGSRNDAFGGPSRAPARGASSGFSPPARCAPIQGEIDRFPLFPWYPKPLKLRIMRWAVENKPELVGHTTTPAIYWWTPWMARRVLAEAGFRAVYDRWQIRLESEVPRRGLPASA